MFALLGRKNLFSNFLDSVTEDRMASERQTFSHTCLLECTGKYDSSRWLKLGLIYCLSKRRGGEKGIYGETVTFRKDQWAFRRQDSCATMSV